MAGTSIACPAALADALHFPGALRERMPGRRAACRNRPARWIWAARWDAVPSNWPAIARRSSASIFPNAFIGVATHLRDNGSFGFNYIEEGELTRPHRAVVPPEIDRKRVSFERGDAVRSAFRPWANSTWC